MSAGRPKKRPRLQNLQNPTYCDSVPLSDNFDQIYAREGRLRRIGDLTLTSQLRRSALVDDAAWGAISSWNPPDDCNYALDSTTDTYNEVLEAEVMPKEVTSAEKPEKKKRSRVSKRPHVVWMELHRQTYLDELLRWEGRGDAASQGQCSDCLGRRTNPPGTAEYRCEECLIPDLTCASCCVRRHRMNPFHRISRWTGSSFTSVSLKSLGLKIQLNHMGMLNVKNCSMFELLRHLHHFSLATKASTYDFYRALELSTTGLGIDVPKSRYRALLRTVLQWRHLKLLKRGGRGNDPSGVHGTQNGELALRCPSCPWPGINLDDNWQNAPDGMKFLYMVFVCMDANFRLKNQLVSNYSQDPGLGIGWAYMVPRKPYEKYVLSKANDDDISTCVGFQALAKANSKFSVGLRYTGTNATVCGRSEMIFPLGVGNLHKGERYSNMDYIFGSVLQLILVALVLVSYDVACQWFVNLATRMKKDWPDEIKPSRPVRLIPAIPKLHYSMHETAGHELYSLNLIPGAGLSDCECPERVWAPHNPLGNSTKTQGPGSRHDVLDDHFNFWNWLKYIGMGATLLRRYRAAVAERNIQTEGHCGLTDVLDARLVASWEKMCEEWEGDQTFPKKSKNPYYIEDFHVSEVQVRKELAAEEEKRLKGGGISLNNTSAASFIGLGLEIEDFQRHVQRLAKGVTSHLATAKEGNLTEQRNVLRARIRIWDQLTPIYMPGLLQYLSDHVDSSLPSSEASGAEKPTQTKTHHPEDADVYLPSRIPPSHRGKFKNKNVRGQREGTRSRAVIDRVHERARAAAAKYRAARAALLLLRGQGDWEKTYQTLADADVRGYQDPDRLRPKKARQGVFEDDHLPPTSEEASSSDITLFNEVRTRRDGTGETRRTISWIWTNVRASENEDNNDELLRVEWAKSRACSARAREEVMLLKEEMQRVLKFLQWKADWWRKRAKLRDGISSELAEGIEAFSLSQARDQDALASHFKKLWSDPLQTVDKGVKDPSESSDDDTEEEGEHGEHGGEDDDETTMSRP